MSPFAYVSPEFFPAIPLGGEFPTSLSGATLQTSVTCAPEFVGRFEKGEVLDEPSLKLRLFVQGFDG